MVERGVLVGAVTLILYSDCIKTRTYLMIY
jgi:hypothetical protein